MNDCGLCQCSIGEDYPTSRYLCSGLDLCDRLGHSDDSCRNPPQIPLSATAWKCGMVLMICVIFSELIKRQPVAMPCLESKRKTW